MNIYSFFFHQEKLETRAVEVRKNQKYTEEFLDFFLKHKFV